MTKLQRHKHAYYLKNRKIFLEKSKKRNANHKEDIKVYQHIWYLKNIKRLLPKSKRYNANHKKEINSRRRKRYKNDVNFRISRLMSCNMWKTLKTGKKKKHWETLVNYSADDLRIHLESLFTEGMSWDNHGVWCGGLENPKWHIDHKKALCEFNIKYTSGKDFKECFALKNLQPLWGIDNIRKGVFDKKLKHVHQ